MRERLKQVWRAWRAERPGFSALGVITAKKRRLGLDKGYIVPYTSHMGGRLHAWRDGSTQWMTQESYYEVPGDDYVGSLYLDPRERLTQAQAQDWLDNGGSMYDAAR